MNKKIINSRVQLLSVIAIAVSFGTNAADGTVNFTGAISDQTCVVDASSANLTVDLGTITSSSFSAAGDTASASRFDISLSGCPGTFTKVAARFDGASNATNPDLLALTNTGTEASGVAIQLSNIDGSVLSIGQESTQFPIDATASTSTLKFIARYQATSSTITPGDAGSVAQFTITYH